MYRVGFPCLFDHISRSPKEWYSWPQGKSSSLHGEERLDRDHTYSVRDHRRQHKERIALVFLSNSNEDMLVVGPIGRLKVFCIEFGHQAPREWGYSVYLGIISINARVAEGSCARIRAFMTAIPLEL